MQIEAGLASTAGCYHHSAVAFMKGVVVIWDPQLSFRLHTLPQLVIGSIPPGNYSGKDGIDMKD